MRNYATIADVTALWRPLEANEEQKAAALLPVISDRLRAEAEKVGKNLDAMIASSPSLANVAKSVTVDILARTLNQDTKAEAMSQVSQSALGYSVSGTYLVPGGGLFVKRSELAALGLRRQRMGVIDLWESPELP